MYQYTKSGMFKKYASVKIPGSDGYNKVTVALPAMCSLDDLYCSTVDKAEMKRYVNLSQYLISVSYQ